MQVGFTVAIAGQRHGETNHCFAIEGSDDLSADALGDEKDSTGNDVSIAVTPDLELENDASLKLFQVVSGWM